MDRRQFVKGMGYAVAGMAVLGGVPFLQGCSSKGGSPAPAGGAAPTAAGGAAPSVAKQGARKITVGVGGWAVEPTTRAMQELNVAKELGIEVEVKNRPGAPPEFSTQMTSAIAAGNSPYDVIDIEDEIAIPFSRKGWLEPLDNIADKDIWDDFTPSVKEVIKVWHQYKGETFRIPHNFEPQIFWHRKDWLDAKGLKAPTTWDELVQTAKALTDEGKGVWGIEDGLAKGAYLNVYVNYLSHQAGGNAYQFDEGTRKALQFIYDMIHTHRVFPAAALNKDYDALNQDYLNDRVGMMRQWPYVYDVARGKPEWFQENKLVAALPPKGPVSNQTYGAAWGWVIPKTAGNKQAAREFVQWITSSKISARLADVNGWFLSARKSVLAVHGDKGLGKILKWYDESGVIGVRPFHEKVVEMGSVVEDTVSAYLSKQISLDETIKQGQARMKAI